MTTRVAALLFVAASACAVDAGDTIDLDALPSYDADTGGGKGDDPNCTDVTYRAFIQQYLGGTATAEANPCTWGNDASYRIWAYATGEKLKPLLAAYEDATQARFTGSMTRDQVRAAGTLDTATKATLAKLAAIRPTHAGKVGIAAWSEYLYAPALGAATQPVGFGQPVPDARDQWTNEITPFEQEWLGIVEQSLPIATLPGAYAIWWQTAEPAFTSATDVLGNQLAAQAAINTAFIAHLGMTHPAGAFDEDGVVYQTKIVATIAKDFDTLMPRVARWTGAAALAPTGGGVTSYKAWAQSFIEIAGVYNASMRTAGQADIFKLVIAARPCASGADVDLIVGRLTTALAAAGNGPDGTPLAQTVVPVACAAPQ